MNSCWLLFFSRSLHQKEYLAGEGVPGAVKGLSITGFLKNY